MMLLSGCIMVFRAVGELVSATFEPPVTVPHQFWIVVHFSNSNAGWFIAGAAEVGFTEDYFGRNVPPWGYYWWSGDPYAGLWANVGVTDDP